MVATLAESEIKSRTFTQSSPATAQIKSKDFLDAMCITLTTHLHLMFMSFHLRLSGNNFHLV